MKTTEEAMRPKRYVILLGKISWGRVQDDKAPLICCVVEQDWPEYEPTWQAIEERVTGGTAGGDRDMEVERLRGLILRATAELEVVEYDNDPPARVVALLDDYACCEPCRVATAQRPSLMRQLGEGGER